MIIEPDIQGEFLLFLDENFSSLLLKKADELLLNI